MESLELLTPDIFIEKSADVLDILSNEANRAKIPLISNWNNFDHLKDMQLVRFRGLVQNMLDPEIYLQSYQVKGDNENISTRNGKYRDNLKLQVKKNENINFVNCLFQTHNREYFSYRPTKKFYSMQDQMCMLKDGQFLWYQYPA